MDALFLGYFFSYFFLFSLGLFLGHCFSRNV